MTAKTIPRSDDGPRQPVLVLEFTGLSVDQKFDRLTRGVACERVDPLAARPVDAGTLPALAARICDGLAGPPAFVLAHCTAAPTALHLAAACRQRFGASPHTVLLDPDAGSPAYLRQEFAVLCGNLGTDPQPALDRAATSTGAGLLTLLDQELRSLAPELTELYGGDEDARELVEHLLARYCGWLAFLAMGPAAGPAPVAGPVTVLTSRSGPDPVHVGLPEGLVTDPARVAVRTCRTDGTPLLLSEAAADALHEVLARPPADRLAGAR